MNWFLLKLSKPGGLDLRLLLATLGVNPDLPFLIIGNSFPVEHMRIPPSGSLIMLKGHRYADSTTKTRSWSQSQVHFSPKINYNDQFLEQGDWGTICRDRTDPHIYMSGRW